MVGVMDLIFLSMDQYTHHYPFTPEDATLAWTCSCVRIYMMIPGRMTIVSAANIWV